MVLTLAAVSLSASISSAGAAACPSNENLCDTGNMLEPTGRFSHTATLLQDGRVLIVGGHPQATDTTQFTSAELYNPASGTFSRTGSMSTPRWGHSAILLDSGPDNGNVLVVGGWISSYIVATDTAELFDPTAGAFKPTDNLMSIPRADSPTLVETGGQFFIIGGTYEGDFGTATKSIDQYDTEAEQFIWNVANLSLERRNNVSCLLPNGLVLIAGGQYNCCDSTANDARDNSAEIFDPYARLSTEISAKMEFPRSRGPTAATLEDGTHRCLLAGGGFPSEMFIPGTDPLVAGQFQPTSAPMPVGNIITPLPDGRAVVSGPGITVYDPARQSFASESVACGQLLVEPIADFSNGTATLLENGPVQTNGKVLLTSGTRAALYDPNGGGRQSYGYFQFEAQAGDAVALDVIDISGTIGPIYMSFSDPNGNNVPNTNTCSGRIQTILPQISGSYSVQVGDCVGNDPGDYSLSLDFLSDNARNCGATLPCGSLISGTLSQPGEVDSYKFSSPAGGQVILSAADVSGTIGPLEIRLFGPDGQMIIDSCSGSVATQLPQNVGAYTLLVDACTGVTTGSYEVVWKPQSCPSPCAGDCNGNGTVTVDEILTMVNIALGNRPVSSCFAGDLNGDGQITVDEILVAVNNALNGCPVSGSA
jgi:hypothetical protein